MRILFRCTYNVVCSILSTETSGEQFTTNRGANFPPLLGLQGLKSWGLCLLTPSRNIGCVCARKLDIHVCVAQQNYIYPLKLPDPLTKGFALGPR